jgi:hypothetical protein
MASEALLQLQKAFQSIKDGPVEDLEIEALLTKAWDSIDGSTETKLNPDKLCRMEHLEKRDGMLYFDIERHGGTVHGSTRARVYTWEVDVMYGSASIVRERNRQIYKADKRLDVTPIAQELTQRILEKQDHQYLRWNAEKTSCTILVGAVIPMTNKQTTSGRRARLRAAINGLLRPVGIEVSARNKVDLSGKLND